MPALTIEDQFTAATPGFAATPDPAAKRTVPDTTGLTHGQAIENLILPTENRTHFNSLLQGLQSEYQPQTLQQFLFVEHLAIGHWFLWRRQRICNAIEAGVFETADNDPASLTDNNLHRLTLAERLRATAERSLKHAFHNAESFRKDRQSQQTRLERQSHWQAEQGIRERRIKVQEDRQKAAALRAAARQQQQEQDAQPSRATIILPRYLPGSDAWKKEKAEAASRAESKSRLNPVPQP